MIRLIIILCVMLAGSAEAYHENKTTICYGINEHPDTHPPCQKVAPGSNFITNAEVMKEDCYQKMRQALTAISPYIVDIRKPFTLQRDGLGPREELDRNQRAVELWQHTMRDCVQ